MIRVCLPSQSAPETHNQGKKAHKPLRTLCISQKLCRPCLIIIKCDYFDYRINKLFTLSSCLVCVSCSIHDLISAYYVRKGSWPFYLNYPQINKVRKSSHVIDALSDRFCRGVISRFTQCFSLRFVPLRPFLHQIPGVQSHLLRSLEPRR